MITASVTNTFAGQSDSIPLSQLDQNFTDLVLYSATIAPAIAFAWAGWTGTSTGTISANLGHNVGSIVRAGTGTYTINFTTPATTSLYIAMASSGGGFGVILTKTTAACTIAMYTHTGAAVDNIEANFLAFST